MYIRIDGNGTLTTSADQNQYSIVFGDILIIIYSIICFILLAIVVTLVIRSHHNKSKNNETVCFMGRSQGLDSEQSKVSCINCLKQIN